MDRLQVPKEKRPKICPKIEKPQADFFKRLDWRAVGLGTDLGRNASDDLLTFQAGIGCDEANEHVKDLAGAFGDQKLEFNHGQRCAVPDIQKFQVHLKTLPIPLLDLHLCLTIRLSPTSRALSPNPKRLWWHVVIWVLSWA